MKFTLEIELGNDAMSNSDDVAEALTRVAAAVNEGYTSGHIRDVNGNTVGHWGFDA